MDAVRKRIQRGKLTGHKTNRGWLVVWTESDVGPENVQKPVQNSSALIESLESQIEYLRDQVNAERDARAEAERRHAAEIERRDVLLREALERIPHMPLGLPAGEHTPQDAHTAPQSDDATARASEPMKPVSDTLALGWRRWWRRITGGG